MGEINNLHVFSLRTWTHHKLLWSCFPFFCYVVSILNSSSFKTWFQSKWWVAMQVTYPGHMVLGASRGSSGCKCPPQRGPLAKQLEVAEMVQKPQIMLCWEKKCLVNSEGKCLFLVVTLFFCKETVHVDMTFASMRLDLSYIWEMFQWFRMSSTIIKFPPLFPSEVSKKDIQLRQFFLGMYLFNHKTSWGR